MNQQIFVFNNAYYFHDPVSRRRQAVFKHYFVLHSTDTETAGSSTPTVMDVCSHISLLPCEGRGLPTAINKFPYIS